MRISLVGQVSKMTRAEWDQLHKATERAEKADVIEDDEKRRAEQQPLIMAVGNLRVLARCLADLDKRLQVQEAKRPPFTGPYRGVVAVLCFAAKCDNRTPRWRQCPEKGCGLDIGFCDTHGGDAGAMITMKSHMVMFHGAELAPPLDLDEVQRSGITRKVSPTKQPGMEWNKLERQYCETDAVFRERLKSYITKDPTDPMT